jgi:hypothetical protein
MGLGSPTDVDIGSWPYGSRHGDGPEPLKHFDLAPAAVVQKSE